MDSLHSHAHKQPPNPTPATTTRLSPLDIPHILDLIFSFLSNHTLLSSVSLVCRDWYLVNRNRIYRTVHFEDGRDEQYMNKFLASLPGAYRLDCALFFNVASGSNVRHIKNILLQHHQSQSQNRTQVQSMLENKEVNMKTTTLFKFSPLRELILRISFPLDATLLGFPFPPTLTSLKLDLLFPATTDVVDLDPILQTCPLLEALTVKARAASGHWMAWTILEQNQQHDRSQDQQQQPHLRLRSLILKNIGFPQDYLENVLLFTPHLKVLKLMLMDWNSGLKYDWVRLMDHIKALGITLHAVDFSLYDPNSGHFPDPPLPFSSSSSPDLASRMHEICPSTTDWTFHASKVTPPFLKTLSLRTSFVTTMELYWNTPPCCQRDLKDAPRLIHEYLCTSPQLVHLRTLKAPIRPEYMDLFGRGTGSGGDGYNTVAKKKATTMPSPHPAIWMCRGLETLHIEVHGKSNPRVLFGYISRVLPQLEELYIARPDVCASESGALIYATVDVQLRDGFCLLSRLRHLERLSIVPNENGVDWNPACNMMNLSWLLSSSSTSIENNSDNAKFKAQRREEVERWDMQRGMEDYRESTRPPGSLELLLPPAGTKPEDREIWHQLRHLGMYLDVEEMVREMDSDGFKPLPSLCQLSLGSFFLQRPKDELTYVLSGKVY